MLSIFSDHNCVCVLSLGQVRLFATLWTVVSQAPLSMGFSRQEYWSQLPCSPQGNLPNPGTEPTSPVPSALQGILYHWATREVWPQLYATRNQSEKEKQKRMNTWRLTNMLLKKQWVKNEIKEETRKYLETNENENTTFPKRFPKRNFLKRNFLPNREVHSGAGLL